ncbi:unnamed protein product [Durusdinium trenchii]|uniref:Uncharacterized protein n=1 Tax=Durusdinium trenchii TaxID=1381693 RepID=A0ABP0Q3S6_9DINO
MAEVKMCQYTDARIGWPSISFAERSDDVVMGGPLTMSSKLEITEERAHLFRINDRVALAVGHFRILALLAVEELTRELLADGLRRALEMLGEAAKSQFLEVLAANIHKFALQEQYSLSRVYPVEISSEYKNLQSFFAEPALEAISFLKPAEPTALSELRRILAALPQMPGPSAEEFVVKLKDEQTSQALKAVNTRSRSSFFGEVRQNLYRLSEASQKELVESFTELKAEVVKLVDSMTQEPAKSQWLQGARWSCWSGWTSWLKDLMNSKCTVVAWKTAEYGFVKREGRHNDDIQLHVANAKGERFKKYVRRYGLQPGVRVKFDVDFEENRGRPFASNWEMVDPPHLSASRSRSGRSRSRCHSHGPKGLACLAQCEAHSGLAQRETAWKSRERAKSASGKKKGTSRSRDKKRSRDRDRRKRKSNSTKRRSRSREKNDRKKKSLSKSRDREKPKRSNASKSRSKSKCEEEKSKKAVLSASFQANFKQIGAGAKRAKEAFLLQMAVCLKTVERRDWHGAQRMGQCMKN